MLFRSVSALAFVAIFSFSCIDQSGYEIDELELNPSVALPLAYGSVSIQDFLNDEDSAHIKVYSDGLIYLAYEEELETQNIGELFEVPDKSLNRSFILPPIVLPASNKDFRSDSIVQVVDFGMSPERLDEIALKSGLLSFATSIIPSNSNIDYEIIISLPDFVSRTTGNGLEATAKGTGSINLSDYTLYLDDNKFDLKLVLVLKEHSNPITISPGSSVNIQLQFGSFEFQYIKGFFGSQSVALDAESIELGVFENVFDEANISLAQPMVDMTVVNDYGVSCKVDFKNLEGRKDSSVLPIVLNPANPINITAPATLGTSATTLVEVVNVGELLDFAPTELFYEAEAVINEGVTDGNNFLADTSKLRVKMGIEVPLYGTATGIVLRDTMDIDLGDVDQSEINSASLKLKLNNELPLDADIQFFLTDDNYNITETLLSIDQTNLLVGSTVNSAGDLQTAGVFDEAIEIEKNKIDKIFSAKHIIIVATMSTSKDSAGNFPDVKFRTNYQLSVEVGLLVSLKFKTEL